MITDIARRIANMLARGTVALANASAKLQTLQVKLLAGEIKDEMEHFEAFGFTANPPPGAEVIAGFFDGDRSHGVILAAADRRHRLKNLLPGEAAMYSAFANKIVLHADGSIEIVAPLSVNITSPAVTMSGTLTVQGLITGHGGVAIDNTVSGSGSTASNLATSGALTNNGKNVGSAHVHSGVTSGGSNTGVPT